jgi:DNA-directed RNA polymerase alpha subunit
MNLDSPIGDLEWSRRCRIGFRRANILILRDLTSKSAGELAGAKIFGQIALTEVRRVLSGVGLSLRDDDDNASLVRSKR